MDTETLATYMPLLKSHWPQATTNSITLFSDGHDHYVFLYKGTHAIRVPRSLKDGEKDTVENIFLKQLAKTSPIRVQEMTSHFDDLSGIIYQTYEFIPGIKLSRHLASTMSKANLESIARDMGAFLSTLHSFPVQKAQEMNMDAINSVQNYTQYFKSTFEKDKQTTLTNLSKNEIDAIEELLTNYIKSTINHPYRLHVTHFDMLPEHIIVDEKSHKLNGVIDFSLRIADPANDFKFFDRYGKNFLENVYRNYLEVDKSFDIRRKFYAVDLPISNLRRSIEGGDKKMIDLHLKQLKKYVHTHVM